MTERARPDALVLGYPVTLAEAGPGLGEELLDVPPSVTARMPPTFVFATSGDTIVPIRHTPALCLALTERLAPFESHAYRLGPHGLSLATTFTACGSALNVDEAVTGWVGDAVRFLHRVFGEFAVAFDPDTFSNIAARCRFGLVMPVGRLLVDLRAAQVVRRSLGEHVKAFEHPMADGLCLRDLTQWVPALTDPKILTVLAAELAPVEAKEDSSED